MNMVDMSINERIEYLKSLANGKTSHEESYEDFEEVNEPHPFQRENKVTAKEIKQMAKDLVKGRKSGFDSQWGREFQQATSKLNEIGATLLEDLMNLYLDYLKGKCSKEDTQKISDGYMAWFQEETERVKGGDQIVFE